MEPGGTSSQATHRSRRPRGRRWNEERHAEWSREVPRLRPPTDRAGPGDAGGMKSDMRNGAGRYLVSGHPPIAPAGDAAGMKSDMRNGAGRYLVSGHPPITPAPRTPVA